MIDVTYTTVVHIHHVLIHVLVYLKIAIKIEQKEIKIVICNHMMKGI